MLGISSKTLVHAGVGAGVAVLASTGAGLPVGLLLFNLGTKATKKGAESIADGYKQQAKLAKLAQEKAKSKNPEVGQQTDQVA